MLPRIKMTTTTTEYAALRSRHHRHLNKLYTRLHVLLPVARLGKLAVSSLSTRSNPQPLTRTRCHAAVATRLPPARAPPSSRLPVHPCPGRPRGVLSPHTQRVELGPIPTGLRCQSRPPTRLPGAPARAIPRILGPHAFVPAPGLCGGAVAPLVAIAAILGSCGVTTYVRHP